MFARRLIESVRLAGAELELAVRLNWYRSLPLSCVESMDVALDDEPVDPSRMNVELGGVRTAVADLPELDDRWWPVLDSAVVRGELDGAPGAGDHTVRLVLASRIPYLVGPDGGAAVIVDRATAVVRA